MKLFINNFNFGFEIDFSWKESGKFFFSIKNFFIKEKKNAPILFFFFPDPDCQKKKFFSGTFLNNLKNNFGKFFAAYEKTIEN